MCFCLKNYLVCFEVFMFISETKMQVLMQFNILQHMMLQTFLRAKLHYMEGSAVM